MNKLFILKMFLNKAMIFLSGIKKFLLLNFYTNDNKKKDFKCVFYFPTAVSTRDFPCMKDIHENLILR